MYLLYSSFDFHLLSVIIILPLLFGMEMTDEKMKNKVMALWR